MGCKSNDPMDIGDSRVLNLLHRKMTDSFQQIILTEMDRHLTEEAQVGA